MDESVDTAAVAAHLKATQGLESVPRLSFHLARQFPRQV